MQAMINKLNNKYECDSRTAIDINNIVTINNETMIKYLRERAMSELPPLT